MIGCFGKIPASADFVSWHGAIPEVSEFDQWLQRTLVDLDQDERWQARFDEMPLCYFSFLCESGARLLGGVVSSRDSSGRCYPFFIFQRVGSAEERLNAHTLSEVFAAQIKPLLIDAAQGMECATVFQRLAALRQWDTADLALYRRVHEKFLNDFELRDIARALEYSYSGIDELTLSKRLAGLGGELRDEPLAVMHFPLPAERGLKRPVADFWCDWLYGQGGVSPAVSVLVDDFMHPGLLCFTSRQVATAYRVLAGGLSCPSLLRAEPAEGCVQPESALARLIAAGARV